MDQPQMQRLTLELERGSDPPRGRVLLDDNSHAFSGWLGLAVALERAIGAERDASRRPAPPVAGR